MKRRGDLIDAALVLAAVGGILLTCYFLLRNHPEDLPWTPLDLRQPAGFFTGRKIAGLGRDFARCRSVLDAADVRYDVLPEVREGTCGYADGVRLSRGGARRIDLLPADVGVACPVAAALAKWEWDVVQPAAIRHFGRRVSAIEHYGSYSCRRIVGSGRTGWSQHATAKAIDISAFRLDDSTRITVRRDWKSEGPRAAFLREVRNGACPLFTIVLSPDYNAAHADHLHLDEAPWGEFGLRGCH